MSMEENKETAVVTDDGLDAVRRENEELKMRLRIMEQNEANRLRSAGTRRTEALEKPYDPFDSVWD